jgi:hypothetical protein
MSPPCVSWPQCGCDGNCAREERQRSAFDRFMARNCARVLLGSLVAAVLIVAAALCLTCGGGHAG